MKFDKERRISCQPTDVETQPSRRGNRTILALFGIVGVIALAEVLDGDGPSNRYFKLTNATLTRNLEEDYIPRGTNIRFDPARYEVDMDLESNRCATIQKAITFTGDTNIGAYQSAPDHSPDGPWVGINLENMPPSVQKDCSDDKDGLLWISEQYVEPIPARGLEDVPGIVRHPLP